MAIERMAYLFNHHHLNTWQWAYVSIECGYLCVQTEDIRKRLRTVEDHNLAMGMELSNLRGNMSNFQQQLTAVTSVINTALGAMAGPRMMTGGGGGALGGLLGFGGGGGHVRPPSTSLLRHTPRTRPNLPRTAAPPRYVTSEDT